ncbi:hypothetical protein ACS0PU_011950 [Formica fusca]
MRQILLEEMFAHIENTRSPTQTVRLSKRWNLKRHFEDLAKESRRLDFRLDSAPSNAHCNIVHPLKRTIRFPFHNLRARPAITAYTD